VTEPTGGVTPEDRCSRGVPRHNCALCRCSLLTFQPLECVPGFPGTSPREERRWHDP
jgi:hypothetical protein